MKVIKFDPFLPSRKGIKDLFLNWLNRHEEEPFKAVYVIGMTEQGKVYSSHYGDSAYAGIGLLETLKQEIVQNYTLDADNS